MTQVATPASLPANMDRLELAFDGIEYKVERRADTFFVRKRSEGSTYGDATTSRARNRFAHPASPVARNWSGPHAGAISLRLHCRRENVGAGESRHF